MNGQEAVEVLSKDNVIMDCVFELAIEEGMDIESAMKCALEVKQKMVEAGLA